MTAPLIAAFSAGTAGATHLGTSTSPTAASLALTQADVRGNILSFSGFLQGTGTPQYVRMFLPRTRTGTTVDSLVVLEPDSFHASAVMTGLSSYTQTDSGRQALSKLLADGMRDVFASPAFRARFAITGTPTISNAVLGQVSQPSPDTLILPNTISVSGVKMHVLYAYVQIDRAIEVVEMFNAKHAPSTSALGPLLAKVRTHMHKGFTVANTAAPKITGTPTLGQTLAVDSGNWSGGASTFVYAWQRCAPDGSACVPIDAATDSAYVVSSADAGSTIRVSVTGGNTVSSAKAMSVPTLVVS